MDRELLYSIKKIVNNGKLLEKDRFLELSDREKVEYINIVSRYRNGRAAIIISKGGYYDADDGEKIYDLTEYAENLHEYGWELFESNNISKNDVLNDLLLSIKAPMRVVDLAKLMEKNGLEEEAESLIQTVKENRFNKNDTIYVDSILKPYNGDGYMCDCDGDKEYFYALGGGEYAHSFTNGIPRYGCIYTDNRAQIICISCDHNFLSLGIVLG